MLFRFLILSLLVVGCGNSSAPPVKEEVVVQTSPVVEEIQTAVPEEIVETVEEVEEVVKSTFSNSQTATLKGLVRYEGAVPKFREIKMDADPICLTHHTEAVFPQTLVLGEGEDQTMGNVFLHIKSGLTKKDFPTPSEPVVVDQKGCMYEPHVVGVMVNQPLKVLNPDGTLHNVHTKPKINKESNLAMPKFRKEITLNFPKAEFMFPVKCDVHPWMGAWITVMDHPFFTVTKPDGLYTIDNLPPGTYELEAWHEKLGTKKSVITLEAGEIREVDFVFSR